MEQSGRTEAQEDTVRLMTVDDIEQICEIEQESFTMPWSAAAFYNELTHNQFAHYMVVERDGRVIGYGGMWNVLDEAHVTNIAVRAAYRGQGIGERIMRELMHAAVYLGSRKMTLEVRVSNAVAQNLYTKLGFRAAGLRKGYYSDNQEDALIMWADLPAPSELKEGFGR
jgi:ribosomal-protein-alanine N-acetyltransferase